MDFFNKPTTLGTGRINGGTLHSASILGRQDSAPEIRRPPAAALVQKNSEQLKKMAYFSTLAIFIMVAAIFSDYLNIGFKGYTAHPYFFLGIVNLYICLSFMALLFNLREQTVVSLILWSLSIVLLGNKLAVLLFLCTMNPIHLKS